MFVKPSAPSYSKQAPWSGMSFPSQAPWYALSDAFPPVQFIVFDPPHKTMRHLREGVTIRRGPSVVPPMFASPPSSPPSIARWFLSRFESFPQLHGFFFGDFRFYTRLETRFRSQWPLLVLSSIFDALFSPVSCRLRLQRSSPPFS